MEETRNHMLVLENREHLKIEGVEEVLSFDETQLEVETSAGILLVQGEGLHVELVDVEKGRLLVTGTITVLDYDARAMGGEKQGVLSRIFR